ncbi:MAG: hypothetical protein H7301_02910 [Cryobacterium sp.]|nr:hypothetical protein [Oligoflexia bacterium]
MKMMKQAGFGILSALSLVGCGGGGGGAAPAQPAAAMNPTGNYYQTQGSQPYNCQSGMIQLRNAFGQTQCFNTVNLAEACIQARGIFQGNLCRRERVIPSRNAVFTVRNVQPYFPVTIPGISASLYAGESLKLSGCLDNGYGDAEWSAQLLQGGVAVGSASSQSMVMNGQSSDNFTIAATSSGFAGGVGYANGGYQTPGYQNTGYPNTGYQNTGYPNTGYQNTGYPNTGYQNTGYQNQAPYNNGAYTNTPYPNTGAYPNAGVYPNGQTPYGNTMAMIPQSYDLQIMFEYREPKVKIALKMSAVTCEDGHGNNYACP